MSRLRQQLVPFGMFLTVVVTLVAIAAAAPTASASAPAQQAPLGATPCLQPPANTDLSTLPAAQLAAYGLPPRVPAGIELAVWKSVLQHAKHRSCRTETTNVTATSREDSDNWAGNIAIGGGYQSVSSTFNAPCTSTSPRPAYSAMWVGLGGDGNDGGGNLVQTGTEEDVDSSGHVTYYAWYEDYPHDPYEIKATDVPVQCGQTMFAYADSNYEYPGKAYMLIENYSNNTYHPATEKPLANGSTAEWIGERPKVNGSFPTLADFHNTGFTQDGTIQNGNFLWVGQTNHNYAVMCNGGLGTCGPFSTQLAHPGPISSNGQNFTVYWDAGS